MYTWGAEENHGPPRPVSGPRLVGRGFPGFMDFTCFRGLCQCCTGCSCKFLAEFVGAWQKSQLASVNASERRIARRLIMKMLSAGRSASSPLLNKLSWFNWSLIINMSQLAE
jgi:hypothetical protein